MRVEVVEMSVSRSLLFSLLIGTTMSFGATAEVPAKPAERVPAVWQEHEVIFSYQNFTTRYSCAGLKTKVRQILNELGARDDAKVTSYGCGASYFEPSPSASVKLRFATLQPSPRETGDDVIAAQWQVVELSAHRPQFLDRGDCFLVERFRDDVLPYFAHEVTRDRTTCIPHQLTGTAPNLHLRVLRPAS